MQVKTKINVRINEQNPLIIPQDVKPSRSDFTIECVFNVGVARYKDEVILLMRVAERPVQVNPEVLRVPVLVEKDGEYVVNV